jgi:hypothetical protein
MPWVVRDAVDEINRAVGHRDVSGVNTLLRHGMQPITVIAARPAGPGPAGPARPGPGGPGTTGGVDTTLLHYAQLNPLSAPFWNRMEYRPLWTGWEARPAVSLR